MAFPLFQNGTLLFCGGCWNSLASSCCGDYDGGWYFDDDETPDFKDLPCEPPTDWDGGWDIATVCYTGDCIGSRTAITVDLSNGQECSYHKAVPLDWGCGKVTTSATIPVDADGIWEVWIGGGYISMAIFLGAGETGNWEMNVPENLKWCFTSTGRSEIRSRISFLRQNGTWAIKDDTVYIYVFEWPGDRWNAQCTVVPHLADYGYIADAEGHYNLVTHTLKSYETIDDAIEIFEEYEDTITAYARDCVCEPQCYTGDPICTASSMDGTAYDGIYSPGFAGCETEPGGDPRCTYEYVWGVDMTGLGYSFYLNRKNPETNEWEELAGGNAPGNYQTSGVVLPCWEYKVFLVAEEGCYGDFWFNGESIPVGDPDGCTTALQDAFNAIP